jgi:tetratricopeptide (TPR) repeat protein
LRAAVDKAIRRRGFVHYSKVPEYARGIEAVVDSLANVLKQGHVSEVRELTERALGQMESAMNHLDDSDGFMGGILERLQDLHYEACREAPPEPAALAKLLLDWEVRSDWGIFSGAVERYADILGEAGLAAYRKLAEEEWAKVPPLAPGDKDPERYGARSRITQIMETLAEQTGDVEALVAVKARDLSDAYSFLKVAEIYKQAGRDDAALEWAERGARAFPTNTDSRLRDFLIEEYHKRARHDEAMAIAWSCFSERPGLHTYKTLHKSARRANRWPPWREKALTLLREEIVGEKKPSSGARWGATEHGDNSDLVEIFLWEGNAAAAWHEAQAGGCSNPLWFRLAEAREKEHPADAVAVYTALLKPTLEYAEQHAYEEAIELLRKIRAVLARTGKDAEFTPIVQTVRTQYKPRRNLMKLLDAEGW